MSEPPYDVTRMMGESPVIRVIPTAAQEIPAGALVRVSLVDASRLDAAARVVSSRVVVHQGGQVQPVELPVPPGAMQRRPVVQVHIDRDCSGELAHGDWFTTQAYPVEPGVRQIAVQLSAI